ncbi:hypothetical protein Fmac_032897 [Flemingia macrophylla]|uniref:Uncharacterized protein n=1 Tax=Flemingia macrophylla TaxID=520843 RepID=A0ABD1L691_9FABA
MANHHAAREKALDRDDRSQLLASSMQEMMPLSLEEFMIWKAGRKARCSCELGDSVICESEALPTGARVCGIRSSNDHDTSVCPSLQQSGVDEHPEAYVENTYSRPPQLQREGT